MLIHKDHAYVIISCMQQEFLPTLLNAQNLIDSCHWLIDFCDAMGIPVLLANHKNLGKPLACFEQRQHVNTQEITTFSCLQDERTRTLLASTQRSQFLLAGAETHISILHTAYSFKEQNRETYVLCDASSSRNQGDHDPPLYSFIVVALVSSAAPTFYQQGATQPVIAILLTTVFPSVQ